MDRESREVIFEMVTLTIISLLVGTFLAQRFKVLVLAPVILLFTVILAFGAGIARADAGWTVGLTATMTIVGLQIGYLLGIGIRHLIVVARASRLRAAFLGGSFPGSTNILPPRWRWTSVKPPVATTSASHLI
jgi:hypothetical protein